MIPAVPTVLGGLARSVMVDLGAEVKTLFGAQTVQLGSALLMMVAQEFDRAAARLVEENRVLAELFAGSIPVVRDDELKSDLAATAADPEPSLMIPELQERNRRLRALLIRLHAHVEEIESGEARALDQRIWTELAASTRRRHLDLAVE